MITCYNHQEITSEKIKTQFTELSTSKVTGQINTDHIPEAKEEAEISDQSSEEQAEVQKFHQTIEIRFIELRRLLTYS